MIIETADGVINSTLDSGHLSTVNTFIIYSASKVFLAISFTKFFTFPFHNSDQQSQRYVEMSSNIGRPHDEFFQPLDELLEGYQEVKNL